jgi:hypothetical protein
MFGFGGSSKPSGWAGAMTAPKSVTFARPAIRASRFNDSTVLTIQRFPKFPRNLA